jgi:hypothetical protein
MAPQPIDTKVSRTALQNALFAFPQTKYRAKRTKIRRIGELPVTLTRPDRSVIPLQKTPISIFVLSFYRSLIARFNRQGGPYPPVY